MALCTEMIQRSLVVIRSCIGHSDTDSNSTGGACFHMAHNGQHQKRDGHIQMIDEAI